MSAKWIRACRAVFGLALLAAAFACDTVLAASIQLNAKIPAAKWKAVRLQNLPKDATVGITLQTSGAIAVIFARQEELRRFPTVVGPLFQGASDSRLSFRVIVPVSGDYYVILDNRAGIEERTVRMRIRIDRGAPKPQSPPEKKPESETRF